MQILTLPKQLNEEKAMDIAEKKGNIMGRLIIRSKGITLKLMYIESKEIIYNMTYLPVPFLGKFFASSVEPKQQKIRMLVEGTRCNPAYLAEELLTAIIDVEDENSIQATTYPIQKMIEDGKYLAKRMVRKQAGRNVSIEAESVRSIYRPYYVAFYGEVEPGAKIRYLPIPADGNEISRVF